METGRLKVEPDEVSVDDEGRVIINNPELAREIQDALANLPDEGDAATLGLGVDWWCFELNKKCK